MYYKMKVHKDIALFVGEKNDFYLLENNDGFFVQHKRDVSPMLKHFQSIIDIIQSVKINLCDIL